MNSGCFYVLDSSTRTMLRKSMLLLIIVILLPIVSSTTRKNSTARSVSSTKRPSTTSKSLKLAKLRVTTTKKPSADKSSSLVSSGTTASSVNTNEVTTGSKDMNVTLILMNSDFMLNSTPYSDLSSNRTFTSMNESEIEREDNDDGMSPELVINEGEGFISTLSSTSTTALINVTEAEELIELREQCFIEGDLSCELQVDLVCFGFGTIDCTHSEAMSSSSSIVKKRDGRSASLSMELMFRNEDEKSCKLSQRTLKCDPWPSKKHCYGTGYCKQNEIANEDIPSDTSWDKQVSSSLNLVAFISVALGFFVLIGASSSYYLARKNRSKVVPTQHQQLPGSNRSGIVED